MKKTSVKNKRFRTSSAFTAELVEWTVGRIVFFLGFIV